MSMEGFLIILPILLVLLLSLFSKRTLSITGGKSVEYQTMSIPTSLGIRSGWMAT